MEQQSYDPWEGFEVISVYTDEQAVEDGVLIDISEAGLTYLGKPINRMTDHLWGEFLPCLQPYIEVFEMTEMQALAEVMRTKLRMSYMEEGWVILPPHLWMIPNEIGGWTVMFPEDY